MKSQRLVKGGLRGNRSANLPVIAKVQPPDAGNGMSGSGGGPAAAIPQARPDQGGRL